MTHAFKYTRNFIDLVAAIVFGLLTALQAVILISGVVGGANLSFILLLTLLTFLMGLMSYMYWAIFLGYRTYVTVSSNEVTKDRGILRPKKTIPMRDIMAVRQVGDQIRIQIAIKREIKIQMNALSLDDIDEIMALIEKHIKKKKTS